MDVRFRVMDEAWKYSENSKWGRIEAGARIGKVGNFDIMSCSYCERITNAGSVQKSDTLF